MTICTDWQRQVERVCATVDVHQIDVLLDQTAWDNCAIPALRQMRPEVPWFSLYTGTPEENLLDQAPLLMRLNLTHWQHTAWLEELMEHCAVDARLLMVISPLPFETLSRALHALSQIKWGGQTGLLRYYDPRIFPLLMASILTEDQRARFLQLACYWGWLDRDARPYWLAGTYPMDQRNTEAPAFMELSDEQCELIGCIGDSHKLLDGGKFDYLEESTEQRFSLLYRLVVQASQENYFGDLNEYVQRAL